MGTREGPTGNWTSKWHCVVVEVSACCGAFTVETDVVTCDYGTVTGLPEV